MGIGEPGGWNPADDAKQMAKAGAKKVGKTVTAPFRAIGRIGKKKSLMDLEADCGKASVLRVAPVVLLDLEDIDLDQLEY